MSLDPYALCPGGTGKKVKFCCSDMFKELNEVTDLIVGGQSLAALDRIRQLETSHPNRACLLAFQVDLERGISDPEKARATANRFLEHYPDNPVALSCDAISKVEAGDPQAALQSLHRALANNQGVLHPETVLALRIVSTALGRLGFFAAALAHFRLLYSLLGDQRESEPGIETEAVLESLEQSPEIPALLKDENRFAAPPEDALWKASYQEQLNQVYAANILSALAGLEKLAETAGQWPTIMRSIATLRLWLADNSGAAQALRTISRRPNLPASGPEFDRAVEAEALLQTVDEELFDTIEYRMVTYAVRDYDNVFATLHSAVNIVATREDLPTTTDAGPAPKAMFRIYGGSIAEIPQNVLPDLAAMPQYLGIALLYGRETDREARLEVIAQGNLQQPLEQTLRSLLSDALGPEESSELIRQVSLLDELLRPDVFMPRELSPADRTEITQRHMRRTLEQRWSNTPLKVLDGKTPLQAAADPALRVQLTAALMLLELDGFAGNDEAPIRALRQHLGISQPQLTPPPDLDIRNASLVDMLRVDPAQLDEQSLQIAFLRNVQLRIGILAKRFGDELIRLAPSADQPIVEFCCLNLANIEPNPLKALEYIEQARKSAEAGGRSTADADLAELPLLFYATQFEQFAQAIQRIMAKHGKDAKVAQRLFMILNQLGIVRPDGTLAVPSAAAPAASAAAPEPSSGLWTPESAAASEKKSALWVPD